MAGSERKRKLKGMGWLLADSEKIVNIYSTSLQRILNGLWTEFPDNLKNKKKNNDFDIGHYDKLISCFNIPFDSKANGDKEMAVQLSLEALSENVDPNILTKTIIRILHSGGKGLNKKIISNKQRGRRRLRIEATYKLYVNFAKSQKGLTIVQENTTWEFTYQVKSHYLPNI